MKTVILKDAANQNEIEIGDLFMVLSVNRGSGEVIVETDPSKFPPCDRTIEIMKRLNEKNKA